MNCVLFSLIKTLIAENEIFYEEYCLLGQWYSTRGTRRHLRGYVKYLCSLINFYMNSNNIFII
jgi:hypothetical protein